MVMLEEQSFVQFQEGKHTKLTRPLQKIIPLEAVDGSIHNPPKEIVNLDDNQNQSDDYDIVVTPNTSEISTVIKDIGVEDMSSIIPARPKRTAAITGEIKRRFLNKN